MTKELEQMKELYDSGEWVCVARSSISIEWYLSEDHPLYEHTGIKYKLIHNKHKEVLDHALSGGNVICTFYGLDDEETPDVFFSRYGERYLYEIIPTKQDLNGHYCLATKEHYDKLIKDGYWVEGESDYEPWGYTHLYIMDNKEFDYFYPDKEEHRTPMHLHNGSWLFGCLEYRDYECELCGSPHHTNEPNQCLSHEPKKVERVTRQDIATQMLVATIKPLDKRCDALAEINNKISDYIEYLEANQKDK